MANKNSTFAQSDFEVIQRDVLHSGHFSVARLQIKHRLFAGGWTNTLTREMIERLPAAAVLPYDPKLDRIILIEQFRMGAINDPTTPWQIEIPAGLLDTNETFEQIAIREAKEEAAAEVRHLKLIHDFYMSPGASTEYIHVFYGEVDASKIEGIHGLKNENEDIRVLNVSAKEALTKLHNREIKNGPTIVALQWFELHHEQLRKQNDAF